MQAQSVVGRETPQRVLLSERTTPSRVSSAQQRPEPVRARTVISSAAAAARPSPGGTPRTPVFYDTTSEVGTAYSRRRTSIADAGSNAAPPLRTSSIKTSHGAGGYTRTYNSSPLVPRHTADGVYRYDPQPHDASAIAIANSMGDTESMVSAAAPAAMWDELVNLKSRMRRIELSGQLPSTTGTAMSRVSDERPRTATTSATTLSGSPKRTTANGQAADVRSTTSSQQRLLLQQQLHQQQQQRQQEQLAQQSPLQRDATQPASQHILLSALQKARPHISNDMYSAMETAATEALSLSQMVGVAGQPGPISSGASTIGTANANAATVTDRQLRRKVDSICRSLTELCIAINGEAAQKKAAAVATSAAAAAATAVQSPRQSLTQSLPQRQQQQQMQQMQQYPRDEPPAAMASPTMTTNKAFASLASSRRAVAAAAALEHPPPPPPPPPKLHTSPRAATRFEERRASFLGTPTTALPPAAPRVMSLAPPISSDNVGRRSSLMISRTRRAASEEPDDLAAPSGRRSSLLRMRRAATEEPQEDVAAAAAAGAGAGRRSSLLVRPRRILVQADDDGDMDDIRDMRDMRYLRSPSRAMTEVSAVRNATAPSRDYQLPSGSGGEPSTPTTSLASSALPRRRLVPSSLNARLVTPQTTTTAITTSPSSPLMSSSSRRFLEQQQQRSAALAAAGEAAAAVAAERDRALAADKFDELRASSGAAATAQRHLSLSQTAMLNRTSSLGRRVPTAPARETALPSYSSAASQVGGYR